MPIATTKSGLKKRASTPADIRAFFADQQKTVLTFSGFSGAGYEEPDQLLAIAADILDGADPATTIINAGATPDGIGAIYELAKRRGFMTTGIVSTEALKHDVAVSPFVDRIFFVEDPTWGGFLEGTEQLSPTSETMVAVCDLIVAIGGGGIARDELLVAKRQGKSITFIPVDMNHARAVKKARKKGLSEPTDFRGAAAALFET